MRFISVNVQISALLEGTALLTPGKGTPAPGKAETSLKGPGTPCVPSRRVAHTLGF